MQYQVKDPAGQTHIIEGPEGANPDDIISQAQRLIPTNTSTSSTSESSPQESPKFYELEKQPGVPKGPGELLSQFGHQMVQGATSPMPGSLLSVPIRAMSETASQVGSEVAKRTQDAIGTVPARAAGFAASAALDPTSYVPVGAAAKPFTKAISDAVAERLPGIFNVLARVPEQSTETLLKEGGKLPEVTKGGTEAITKKVQNALENAVKEKGTALNEAKTKVGLPVTPDEKIASLKEHGNEFGISPAKDLPTVKAGDKTGDPHAVYSYDWQLDPNQPAKPYFKIFGDKAKIEEMTKVPGNESGNTWGSDVSLDTIKKSGIPIVGKLDKAPTPSPEVLEHINGPVSKYVQDFKSPKDLALAIDDFKKNSTTIPENQRVKIGSYLQDQINKQVDFTKPGNSLEGILKTQYKDLADLSMPSSLQQSKSGMKDALSVLSDLEKKIGKDPGTAQKFLERIFTTDNPQNKDWINKLAKLETVSGQPVLTDLAKHFAAKSFSKMTSRAGLETAEAVHGAVWGMAGHPLVGLGTLGLLAAQSPKLLGGLTKAAINTPVAKPAALAAMTAAKGFPLNTAISEASKRALQSAKDKLKRKK